MKKQYPPFVFKKIASMAEGHKALRLSEKCKLAQEANSDDDVSRGVSPVVGEEGNQLGCWGADGVVREVGGGMGAPAGITAVGLQPQEQSRSPDSVNLPLSLDPSVNLPLSISSSPIFKSERFTWADCLRASQSTPSSVFINSRKGNRLTLDFHFSPPPPGLPPPPPPHQYQVKLDDALNSGRFPSQTYLSTFSVCAPNYCKLLQPHLFLCFSLPHIFLPSDG